MTIDNQQLKIAAQFLKDRANLMRQRANSGHGAAFILHIEADSLAEYAGQLLRAINGTPIEGDDLQLALEIYKQEMIDSNKIANKKG